MALISENSATRDNPPKQVDVVVVGGGVAGISLALHIPESLSVILITKHTLGESNTRYAQGGLAAAVGQHDSPTSHMQDTLLAGAGHCDARAVQALVDGAAEAVTQLLAAGTRFDPAPAGAGVDGKAAVGGAELALGHEAAHSHHRVLHAQGDATGAEIERALVAALRAHPNITVLEHTPVVALDIAEGPEPADNVCRGVVVLCPDCEKRYQTIAARAVVLANGGAGRLWRRTSNPAGATADGLALAWRAGTVLTDLEFMQFHPTVLVPPDPGMPAFLITEAVRGEGGYLRNHAGERFMLRYPGAELAPRDVVARGILQEMLREGQDHVWLDLSHLDADLVRSRFPTIAATCAGIGIDITRDLIPVAPAAHYFMGGIAVDCDARTTVRGLWAVGEVACTGVHGANRLASNSLLEGVVFGRRAAEDIPRYLAGERQAWPDTPLFAGAPLDLPKAVSVYRADPGTGPLLQTIMWERAGLYRDAEGLSYAASQIAALAGAESSSTQDRLPEQIEVGNMLTVAQLIVAAAQARHESRGGHARSDYPEPNPALTGYRYFIQRSNSGDDAREAFQVTATQSRALSGGEDRR